jgi:hypothetical protein
MYTNLCLIICRTGIVSTTLVRYLFYSLGRNVEPITPKNAEQEAVGVPY